MTRAPRTSSIHRGLPAPHSRAHPPQAADPDPSMPKLSPSLQRLVLAFTTGLFLACAAHVSAPVQGGASAAFPTQ